MGYRDAPPGTPTVVVVHGPFPIGHQPLALAGAALAIASLGWAMAFDDARLTCDRAADHCTYRDSHLVQRVNTFRLSQIQSVKTDVEYGAKGHRSVVPILDLGDGQLRLKSVEPDEADRFSRALRRDLDQRRASFSVDLRADRGALAMGGTFLVVAILALFFALRRVGRVTMIVDGRVLRLARSVFGIPTSRRAVELGGVDDVEIEWEKLKPFWSKTQTRTHGRLVLVRGAEREPLTPIVFPGYHLHLRAQAALREALLVPPRSPSQADAEAARARSFEPQPIAGGVVTTLILAWMGCAGGGLVGFVLGFAVVAVLGLNGVAVAPLAGGGMALGALLGIATGVSFRRASTR